MEGSKKKLKSRVYALGFLFIGSAMILSAMGGPSTIVGDLPTLFDDEQSKNIAASHVESSQTKTVGFTARDIDEIAEQAAFNDLTTLLLQLENSYIALAELENAIIPQIVAETGDTLLLQARSKTNPCRSELACGMSALDNRAKTIVAVASKIKAGNATREVLTEQVETSIQTRWMISSIVNKLDGQISAETLRDFAPTIAATLPETQAAIRENFEKDLETDPDAEEVPLQYLHYSDASAKTKDLISVLPTFGGPVLESQGSAIICPDLITDMSSEQREVCVE